MSVYNIAGLSVEYNCTFSLLKDRSEKYLAPEGTKADFSVALDEAYFKRQRERLPDVSDEIHEYMGTGTAFYKKMLAFDGIMLHASAVAVDGYAYLFSASSGTGKSTHTSFWQELLGKDRAVIINDDKPAIRKVDGVYYAFGTPFSGKHDISVNCGFPVKGICFIRRGETNRIRYIDKSNAVGSLFYQTIRPSEDENMELLCANVDGILRNISFYELECLPNIDAARLSYKIMSEDNNPFKGADAVE